VYRADAGVDRSFSSGRMVTTATQPPLFSAGAAQE
jgi:hypothetical protein